MEQLAILVSGGQYQEGKLLATIPIQSGTGKSMAEKVMDIVSDWGVTDSIRCMVFDTTSSNTGRIQGAATRIKVLMDNNLMWPACRHHVFEMILEAAWNVQFEESHSKDNLYFRDLQSKWTVIDKSEPLSLEVDQ